MSNHELNRAIAALFERRMTACGIARRDLAERVKIPHKAIQPIVAGNAAIHPTKLGAYVRALELRDTADRHAFLVLALNRFASKDQETSPIIREYREVVTALRDVLPAAKAGATARTLNEVVGVARSWEYTVPGAGMWMGVIHPFPHDKDAQRIYPGVYDISYAEPEKRPLYVDCHYGAGPERLVAQVQATVRRLAVAYPDIPHFFVTITRVTAAELTCWTLWVVARDARSFQCVQMPESEAEAAEPIVVSYPLPPPDSWIDTNPLPVWDQPPASTPAPPSEAGEHVLDDPDLYLVEDGWKVLVQDEDAGSVTAGDRTIVLRGGARYRVREHKGYDIDEEPAAAPGTLGELVAINPKRGLASLRTSDNRPGLVDLHDLDLAP